MIQKSPLVSVIIANYNGEQYIGHCLDSLLLSTFKDFEVIIADDGSTDKSVSIIQKYIQRDKRIVLVVNKKNLGASASRNQAVRNSIGKYLLFLDNDTEITSTSISDMVKTIEKSKEIGGCQALLLDFNKRDLIQNAGVKLWAATGWGLPSHQWQNYTRVKFPETTEIIAISAALMVRREVFLLVNGFDEDEAIVTEDLDFSWRVWVAGYQLLLSSHAIVYHMTKDVTMRKNMHHDAQRIYYHLTKNSFTSIIKNYEFGNAVRYLPVSLIISIARALLVLIRRKDTSAISAVLNAIFWVVRNFPAILEKRTHVHVTRKTKDKELFGTIILQYSPVQVYKEFFTQTQLL